MAKEWARGFYSSKRWQDCRESYAKSVGYLCEDCLAKGIVKPGEIVHHVTPLTPGNITLPEVALSFDNLRLVCRECHADEHGRTQRRYKFSDDGKIFLR